MRLLDKSEVQQRVPQKIYLRKDTFDRAQRREYVTRVLLKGVQKNFGAVWLYDDNNIFEDNNALFQCVKNIVDHHPQMKHLGVYWKKHLPYVYVYKLREKPEDATASK